GAQVRVGAPRAAPPASVTVAVIPAGTSVAEMADAGLSVGVLSAGIGQVPAEQTYLDVSQGNRVQESLYDGDLPPRGRLGASVPGWAEIASRGDDAPADITPGLLASTLKQNGLGVVAETGTADPAALIAADRAGVVHRTGAGGCLDRLCPGLAVVSATLGNLPALEDQLRGPDALIAISPPPRREHGTLAIGAVGSGSGGGPTSDSTRTPGYVLTTDLAPTILRRLGVAVPAEMNGEPIRSDAASDPGAVRDRSDRMTAVAERRAP